MASFCWLSDQNVAFSTLERSGKVFAVTGPVRSSDAKLRRAQALAFGSEVGLKIARELISRKLDGQEQLVRDILRDSTAADEIAEFRAALPDAEQLDAIRFLESQAAAAYWATWRDLPIMFPAKDLPRVPEHWRNIRHAQVFAQRLSTPCRQSAQCHAELFICAARMRIPACGSDAGPRPRPRRFACRYDRQRQLRV
jgi:hypothetical protein